MTHNMLYIFKISLAAAILTIFCSCQSASVRCVGPRCNAYPIEVLKELIIVEKELERLYAVYPELRVDLVQAREEMLAKSKSIDEFEAMFMKFYESEVERYAAVHRGIY